MRRFVRHQNIAALGGYSFTNSEASALVARMTTPPTNARKALIDTLFTTLKAIGLTKFDAFYMLAAADSQAAGLNWISTSFPITAVNSPTFAADRGYTGDGATSYLRSAYNPTTASSPALAQNSSHGGVWCATNVVSATAFDFGVITFHRIDACANATTISYRCSSVTSATPSISGNTSVGWTAMSRQSDAANAKAVRNNGTITSTATNSVAAVNGEFLILANNNTTTGTINPSGFTTRQTSCAHWGSELSDQNLVDLYAALLVYMQGVGNA